MKEEIIRCPICSKIVALKKGHLEEKLETVHGICWSDIGYSRGGWGSRSDFMNKFSGEVCDDCFNALETKINELRDLINERKDSCDEGICIYKRAKDKTGWDNVPSMQEDELQHQRHKKPLLRLLSFISLKRLNP